MAGKGWVTSVCREVIIQLERSNETSRDSVARPSGISVNKFEDRLNDLNDGIKG